MKFHSQRSTLLYHSLANIVNLLEEIPLESPSFS